MCDGWERRPRRRSRKPGNGPFLIAGIILLASGLLLLFLCIPGWAWEAMIGVLLAVAGILLIRAGGR